MTANRLVITLHGNQVGQLMGHTPDFWTALPIANASGDPAMSWSLQGLTSTLSEHTNVQGWFRALLPDAATCHTLALQRGLTPGHDFALLASLGRDCPGAVSLLPAQPTTSPADHLGSDIDLGQALATSGGAVPAILVRALWPDDGGVLPVVTSAAGPGLPSPGEPSTALLRTARSGLADAVLNEAFCMHVAAAVDVPVVRTELAADSAWLLCERPDVDPSSPSGRTHMESFGQLLGLPAEQGFEREGGLALLDCVGLIRRYSCVPALDLRGLLRWVVFCHLVGNGLGCGRDLKFLFTPKGPRLAPFVGILSTHVYAGMSERLGFYVGREDRPDWLLPARWRELAEELGVGQRYLLALLKALAQALPPAVASAREAWPRSRRWNPVLEQVAVLAGKRARQLWVSLEAERG